MWLFPQGNRGVTEIAEAIYLPLRHLWVGKSVVLREISSWVRARRTFINLGERAAEFDTSSGTQVLQWWLLLCDVLKCLEYICHSLAIWDLEASWHDSHLSFEIICIVFEIIFFLNTKGKLTAVCEQVLNTAIRYGRWHSIKL